MCRPLQDMALEAGGSSSFSQSAGRALRSVAAMPNSTWAGLMATRPHASPRQPGEWLRAAQMWRHGEPPPSLISLLKKFYPFSSLTLGCSVLQDFQILL